MPDILIVGPCIVRAPYIPCFVLINTEVHQPLYPPRNFSVMRPISKSSQSVFSFGCSEYTASPPHPNHLGRQHGLPHDTMTNFAPVWNSPSCFPPVIKPPENTWQLTFFFKKPKSGHLSKAFSKPKYTLSTRPTLFKHSLTLPQNANVSVPPVKTPSTDPYYITLISAC